jgi:tripartite-type tricarboxylate transporter receptor subunit TctC
MRLLRVVVCVFGVVTMSLDAGSASAQAYTLAASSPNVLVVHPSLPVKSAKELMIALARARPEIRERLLHAGMDAMHTTPDHFAATIKSEMGKWGRIIRESGLRE